MALKDCIKKMGKAVSKADRAALQQYLDDGLNDDQAIRKLYIAANQNVIDITERAKSKGAEITPAITPITNLIEMQRRNLDKIRVQQDKLFEERDALKEELGEIDIVEDRFDEFRGTGTNMDAASALLFGHKEGLRTGLFGLKGTTPLEVLDSFNALQDRKVEVNERLPKVNDQIRELNDRRAVVFHGKQQTLYQTKRGTITFDEAHQAVIRIGQSRNLSTFLHESGHLYLMLMRDLARMEGAPQQIKDDFATILKYLGVDTWEQLGRDEHELWARSFEAYLREGKAPSLALQDAFSAFRAWLLVIYDSIRKLLKPGEQLSDEIRGVMDRIMASDEAIKDAERVQEYAAFFASAEQMGVSPEVFQLYRNSLVKAHNNAVDDETRKLLAAMQREGKVQWEDARQSVEAEVATEAGQMPVYKALAMLQRGTNPDGSTPAGAIFKLDRDDLIRRFGKDFIKRLPNPRNNINPGNYVYSIKNGVDADVAATIFGFENGEEMVQALIMAPKMDAWVQGETDIRMRQRFPDPMTDGTLVEGAVRAVHSERRSQVLVAELRAVGRLVREDRKIVSATKKAETRADREALAANKAQLPTRDSLPMIKAAARLMVARLKIRNMKPNAYLAAERTAARKAFVALEKRDYQTAYTEKLKQIRNVEMYRAALKAEKATASAHKYLKKFESRRVQMRLKGRILDGIFAVLEGIDLRKVSMAQADRETAMAQIIAAVDEGSLVVPPNIMAKLEDRGTNWQNLTVEEFRGIRDVVKQLEHQHDKAIEHTVNGEVVVLQDAADAMIGSIIDNNKAIPFGVRERTRGEQARKGAKSVIAHWQRPGSIARILDDAQFGALTRHLVIPIRRAYTERLVPMLKKARLDVTGLYLAHYNNAELREIKRGKKDFATISGEAMSKSDVLSIALNWGNEGNRTALLQGVKLDGSPAYTEQGIAQALASLSAKDFEFVQAVWDYMDSYWPQLAAAEKQRRGIAPSRVDPLSFTVRTSDGQVIIVEGGYYPLAYNPEHSDRTKVMEFEDHYKKIGNGVYISASTRAGATHERVQNHGHVVKLGLNLIDRHLREIIRDISIGDEINFVKNLLNKQDVRNAFKTTNNFVALDEFNLWLTDSAVGELPAIDQLERWVNYSRIGFTVSKLAYNVMTTALQLTGTFQSIAVIGSEAFAHGVGQFLQNPVAVYKEVIAGSHFMSVRYKEGTWDKDVHDTGDYLKAAGGGIPTISARTRDRLSYSMFWPIMRMQSVVDVATWLGANWKAINKEGLNEADAILYADATVENSQTSGLFSDRSGIERGTLSGTTRQSKWIRLWTTLVSYMLAKGNIAFEKGVALKKRPTPANVILFLTDMILLYTMEGLASAAIYGRWPDDDDDDSFLEFAAKETALSVASGIPLLREGPGAMYGGGNTPIGALAHDMFDLYIQIGQGEMDDTLRRKAVNVGGLLLHLPSSQTNRLIDAIESTDDIELYEYFTGIRNKK